MRPNGLPLALAALLVPMAAFAQANTPDEGAPPATGEARALPPDSTEAAPPSVPGDGGDAATTGAATPGPLPHGDTNGATDTIHATDATATDSTDTTGARETSDATDTNEATDATDVTVTTDGSVEAGAVAEAVGDPGPGESSEAPAAPAGIEAAGGDTAEAAARTPEGDGLGDVEDTERAFAEIYGSGSATAETAPAPTVYDPWERYNRKMHRFNNAVDRAIARPLARGYVKVVPRPVRLGVSNFFNNLSQPLSLVNSLLQGKPRQAGQALGRFLLNSTFGIGGIFDPAARANLPQKSEDFGQTLGVWGWRRSRYVELPLFGPRTVRDVFGMGGDAPLSPVRRIEADRARVSLQGLQLVDIRAQLLSTDSLREGAEDDYALVRDAWSQRRDYQIFGDRLGGDEGLPDYLREDESDRTVPVDAMPVVGPGGG